jgi:hypothetical protein
MTPRVSKALDDYNARRATPVMDVSEQGTGGVCYLSFRSECSPWIELFQADCIVHLLLAAPPYLILRPSRISHYHVGADHS